MWRNNVWAWGDDYDWAGAWNLEKNPNLDPPYCDPILVFLVYTMPPATPRQSWESLGTRKGSYWSQSSESYLKSLCSEDKENASF